MNDDPLNTPVQFLSGTGPERARLLSKLNLHTVQDLLWYLPREVLDLSDTTQVEKLQEGIFQTVQGSVVDIESRPLSKGRRLTSVLIDSQGETVRGNWFNQSWVLRKIHYGNLVLFSGKPKQRKGQWEFSHPRIQWIDQEDTVEQVKVLVKYGLTEGLKMYELRRIIRHAVEQYADFVPEFLPTNFRDEHELPEIKQALRELHLPESIQAYQAARRRMIFDDLFEFQLGLALRRRVWKSNFQAPPLKTTAKLDARIRRLFPFSFTEGQNHAIQEICTDLNQPTAMHRLLQADVGVGKTAVAAYVLLVAVACGYQAALMAPTEILATQHWETFNRLLAQSQVKRLFLTGKLTSTQRRQALEDIKLGHAQLIVGTQAIIQKDIEFQNLGLVVIDEQHKFGVMQRAQFSSQDSAPHILVMTATPIPRSLCLTQFGDLDLSMITEYPPGRQKVVTQKIQGERLRKKTWNFLRQQLQTGRQLYIVCPRVEQGTDENQTHFPMSAEAVYQLLKDHELADFNVALVHGQLPREVKADVMEQFRLNQVQAIVSTTVVEVGVDVPNATLMAIFHAERFGLLQLHQLRGRISRGKYQGYCFLFSETNSEDGLKRLEAMESTRDGFKISEIDFELRGPGDVFGTRQHGQLPLKVADLIHDRKLLKQAREAAFSLVQSSDFDQAIYAPLKIRILERFRQLMDLPQSG